MAKYKDISVNDFCDHLCGGGDLSKFWGISINNTEMFEFIQEKTDNFNRVKLQYFILDVRNYILEIPINIYVSEEEYWLPYQYDYSQKCYKTNIEEYCKAKRLYIEFSEHETLQQRFDKIENLDYDAPHIPTLKGLYSFCSIGKMYQFAEIAEKEYKRVCETAKPNKDDKTDLIVSTLINKLSLAEAKLQNQEEFNKHLLESGEKKQELMWELNKQITIKSNESKTLNNNSKPQTKPILKQFNTSLTDTQRGKLFDLLVSNGFIPDKDKAGFIWAFGGENNNYTSYSIKWLKTKNLGVYLIDKICIDNGRLWAIGSLIFGIKNMAQIKQQYFSINQTGKPKGYELIDTIILEAQK
ncbi:hypothetical protein EOM39_05475 [Candidatus Gracilibacteria bacterium]|nr:hypothetical protein [Candidatus Gracilibacteria bacterium]